MKNATWTKAIKGSADPKRAGHYLDLLGGAGTNAVLAQASVEQATLLAALFSGSQALSNLLVKHPEWLTGLDPQALKFPRRKQGLRQELKRAIDPSLEATDYPSALSRVREFKSREMLRIGARDLGRLARMFEVVQELSDLADVCLDAVWQICRTQLSQRHGQPFHQNAKGDWEATASCVLGLGKLGGQELNYSSDVDVIFVYTEEGSVFREPPSNTKPKQPILANHQFFKRLAEAFIAEVTRMAPEGTLYRIDLRLRPEGDGGPLSRSLASFETYYAQWGQTWERMMLIKARGVAGDPALAAEFLELIQPFRYPRSINQGVLQEVGAMKDRIENEVVKTGEIDRNVKLGRGGIREVEFIAQSLQLLHAGRQPFLQGPQTVPCLEKLAEYDLLSRESSRLLREAYVFFRDLEHRLQMEDNRQTHTIPSDHRAQERLARLMNFTDLRAFETARHEHAREVRRIFDELLKGQVSRVEKPTPYPREFAGTEDAWKQILANHGFRDPEKALKVLREFAEGPGYVHVSNRTRELAFQLLPRLFALCPGKTFAAQPSRGRPGQPPLSDPDRVLTRLDSFISAYGARATLFELWASNPGIFELLLLLFDRSEFLAELAIRTPDLVDELVTSDRLRQRKSSDQTFEDLRHGLSDPDQALWLRKYHQAELMRIGLRDILGLADEEQYLTELSGLADACLRYALEVVTRQNKLKTPPFAIIGLGKLGGAEIDYGSDLDIVFVARSTAKNLQKLSRLAVQVLELISKRTEQGALFQTDTRLRPDGEKGLLVNTEKAFEEYYRQRAALWELQTLTRTRFIAGDSAAGARFQRLAGTLTDFRHPPSPLVAFTPDWKQKIQQMRLRIEKERTPRGKDELAIKTGAGGLMDAEFIAQVLCLENGWREANTMRALLRGRSENALPDPDQLIENYRRLRRLEGILRRWSYEGETVLPDDPAPYRRVAVRCGFATPEAFREAVTGYRRAVREVYSKVFST